MKLEQKFIHIYKNKQIEDLEDEYWIDILNFDGIYNVSNLGRIKSLYRIVNGRWGSMEIREKIMSQCNVSGDLKCSLSCYGNKKLFSVSNLVYLSFNKDNPIKPGQVIMHIDKNRFNNNLINLKIATYKESSDQNFLIGVHSIEKSNKNLIIANNANKQFYKNQTHKICNVCNNVKIKYEFIKEHNICKICYNNKMKEKRQLIKLMTV